MSTTVNASRSTSLRVMGAVVAVVAVVGGGFWLGLGSDESSDSGAGGSADPYRDAVSDKRTPKTTVSVRDNNGQSVADVSYDATNGRIPMRGTTVYLQTLDADTWSTAYSLSNSRDEIVEGVPEFVDTSAVAGAGPDTYQLPDLDPDDTYRICVTFMVGHPANEALGCSAPFQSD